MRIPKRFKIHEAATADLSLSSSGFVARGHACAVTVPVLAHDDRPELDLPRLDPGERREATPIDRKALQVATQGAKGEGHLALVYAPLVEGQRLTVVATEVCAGDGKPKVQHECPDTDPDEHEDTVQTVFRDAVSAVPMDRIGVEVCLNAEVLARVAAAVGAVDGEVRLKFRIIPESGRCDTDHGMILVRPVSEPDGAYGVVMAVAVP